jgi:uncharacterized membrane protein (UPF0136 family)
VRFICTIATVTLLGSFIRRSTRDRVQPPVPPPIIGILEILGRYHYRYNFCPRVVIPLQQG